MKAIIVAAGRGTRISRKIEEIPKCTLEIAGEPLIRRTVKKLLERNIEPIVCVGYRKEKIFEALEGLNVKYYDNPFFDVTNSIASLWFAKDELQEDTLIMNADIYFTDKTLDDIIKTQKDPVLMVDKRRIEEGDFFLTLKDENVVQYGKELELKERSCEYVGIGKISSEFCEVFKVKLKKLIEEQHHYFWWENVLYSMIDELDVKTIDVQDEFWSEIDFYDDYERILQYVSKKKN